MPRRRKNYDPSAWLDKYDLSDLKQLKQAINTIKQEGKSIVSHFKKLEAYYDDWQDKVVQIDQAVYKMVDETGLTVEEIMKPQEENALDGLL